MRYFANNWFSSWLQVSREANFSPAVGKSIFVVERQLALIGEIAISCLGSFNLFLFLYSCKICRLYIVQDVPKNSPLHYMRTDPYDILGPLWTNGPRWSQLCNCGPTGPTPNWSQNILRSFCLEKERRIFFGTPYTMKTETWIHLWPNRNRLSCEDFTIGCLPFEILRIDIFFTNATCVQRSLYN